MTDVYQHEVIDYSSIVQDVVFARLVTLPFFEGFVARRSPQLPTQKMHLPYLGVYGSSHAMDPDGDPNQGHHAFIARLRLGISVQVANNDTVELRNKLNRAEWEISSIWADQYFANLLDTYNPHTGTSNPLNMRIEAVERISSEINWASSLYNETPWAELQYETLLRYGRPYFSPGPFDEFERMDVQSVPLRKARETWQVRYFAHLFERNAWIAANEHRYKINVLSETAVEYRDIVPQPPLPPENEVKRIIMRYEFIPGEGAKPRPYPPDPP